MENREQQILSDIKSLMNSVRLQLEQLDAKMAELQQVYDPQGFDAEPIDIELDVFPAFEQEEEMLPETDAETVEEPLEAPVEETFEEVSEDVIEEIVEDVPEVVELAVEAEPMPEPEQEPEQELEPLFMEIEDIPEAQPEKPQSRPAAVIDVMATKQAWRTDMPGTPVKDIRAAIALVDRALFINRLFSEDAMAFLETLNHINQAASLDEAVDYLAHKHPEWDFDSDIVYRFMMAVRRKIN
jgi:hypothetical protein